ncbi:MAG: branched-chain amino acid transport system substrate-binding protein [Gaiellaceae bacterium]|nr:branched-chain amino acid transport system substrate-binding protein [Gaiellaceae bacterium]
MDRGRRFGLLGALVALILLAGSATAAARVESSGHASAKAPVKVGIVYSRTGALAGFGAEYLQGFKAGLQYLTKGTNTVNGHKLQITYVDDGTDAAKAVAAGKDLIGQGYKILAGSTSSGVALQMAPLAAQNKVLFISGPAAGDAITGLNRYTFRSGRQSYQDVLDAANFIPRSQVGAKVYVFAEDTAFGASNVAAVRAVFGGRGHTVSSILVPFNASDLTPFAQRLKNAGADLVFIAWAGPNSAQMWQALQQQGVPRSTKLVTGLADRVTYPALGPALAGINLLSHYVANGPKKNKVNTWLVKQLAKSKQVPDLFTPDGFVAAQMIVRAVQKANGDDVEKMISALEGWQFLAPKGKQRIRPQDHAMIQPMFQVQLVLKSGKYTPKVIKVISPGNVQPPVKSFP